MADKMGPYTPYSYVFNNPIRLTDPIGMAPEGPGPKWWRTFEFGLINLSASFSIGSVISGLENISTNVARFSTRGSSETAKSSVLNEPV